jgi:hypothetical protein
MDHDGVQSQSDHSLNGNLNEYPMGTTAAAEAGIILASAQQPRDSASRGVIFPLRPLPLLENGDIIGGANEDEGEGEDEEDDEDQQEEQEEIVGRLDCICFADILI